MLIHYNTRKQRFPFSDGIRYGQFHPAGIVFVLRRHLSDGAFFSILIIRLTKVKT
ncbi:hypothetical protein [Neisseria meningitidis]|uniref:hypothetical protein n=1 Tax=Neisseria meningitidis TaxID=487 RepID=UPI0018E23166|nr:hypothetical protein [Neisseria meningitidis]